MEHILIFEIKSEDCLGFDVADSSQVFYFIDSMKVVHKLQMMGDNFKLIEVGLFFFKDKDKVKFNKTKP